MTNSLGRRSGAVAALLTALFVATPASPAAAAEGGPIITIDVPRADPPLDTGSVTVSGSARAGGAIYRMKEVTLTAGGDTKRIECAESPCTFSWTLARPLNGPYQLKVTATQVALLLGTAGPSNEATHGFAVAAPPAKPTLDPPKVTDGRGIELSWTRNSEPDMLYYALFRKDPGASELRRVGGDIGHPDRGTRVTFTDTTTSLLNGGDYAYQVVAVRKGASGTAGTEATSDPSGSARATVPAPPTTTPAPAPGSPAAGPTTTAKPGPPAGVDLSGFLSSRSQPVALPPITVPEAPDTGFGNLPFGAGLPGDELEEGEAEAVPPRDRSSVFSRVGSGRPLVPVAGGLVLLLLALHMRVLNRRIKAPVDGDLPVEGDVPAAELEPPEPVGLVAEPAPVVEPDREPATRFYDIAEEADWAPVAVELEPEPEPDPDPDPEPAMLLEDIGLGEEFQMDDIGLDELRLDQVDHDEVDLEEEIEVFEVVSPTRRPLARAGSR